MKEYKNDIDCRECGKCCKNTDVDSWRTYDNPYSWKINPDDKMLEEREKFPLNKKGCAMLLEDGTCFIYGKHPKGCKEFKCDDLLKLDVV